jgi:hypothetical protein
MKRIIYLIASVILGLLLSIITHALIEIQYLKQVDPASVVWINGCALPSWLKIALPIIFAVGFFFIGRIWWHLVYVERRHWRFKNK